MPIQQGAALLLLLIEISCGRVLIRILPITSTDSGNENDTDRDERAIEEFVLLKVFHDLEGFILLDDQREGEFGDVGFLIVWLDFVGRDVRDERRLLQASH